MSGVFLDTNVVLYLLSADERKANIVEGNPCQRGRYQRAGVERGDFGVYPKAQDAS